MVNRSILIPHGVNILYFVQMGLALPFLGTYFFQLSGGNFLMTGLITAIPLVFLTVASPIWGTITDYYGSKPVIFFSFLSTVLCYSFLAVVGNPDLFFVLYCFFNFSLAGFTPSIQRMMSQTSENQGEAFGGYMATASFGFLIGSVISGVIFDIYGLPVIFLLSVAVCSVGALVALLIPDSSPSLHKSSQLDPSELEAVNKIVSPQSLLRGTIGRLFVLYFLIYSAMGIGATFSTVFLLTELSVPSSTVGLANGIATGLGAIVSVIIGAVWFSRRIRGLSTIFVIGIMTNCIVWGIFAIVPTILGFSGPTATILLLTYFVPAYVGLVIAAPALISKLTSVNQRGKALGILSGAQNLGNAAGATIGGIVAAITESFQIGFAVTFVSLIFLLILALIVLPKKEGE